MLTESQYRELLPHRADIIKFYNTKKLRNHDLMILADKIRQNHRMGVLCFNCDGDKIQAMTDIYNMFVNYEAAHGYRAAIG